VVFYIVRKLLWGLLRMAKWVQALAVKLDLSLIPVIWRRRRGRRRRRGEGGGEERGEMDTTSISL
jgi:hypothetical protein